MIVLRHRCVCGHEWTEDYPSGAVVDPTCPSCLEANALVRPDKKAWYERVSATLERVE